MSPISNQKKDLEKTENLDQKHMTCKDFKKLKAEKIITKLEKNRRTEHRNISVVVSNSTYSWFTQAIGGMLALKSKIRPAVNIQCREKPWLSWAIWQNVRLALSFPNASAYSASTLWRLAVDVWFYSMHLISSKPSWKAKKKPATVQYFRGEKKLNCEGKNYRPPCLLPVGFEFQKFREMAIFKKICLGRWFTWKWPFSGPKGWGATACPPPKTPTEGYPLQEDRNYLPSVRGGASAGGGRDTNPLKKKSSQESSLLKKS